MKLRAFIVAVYLISTASLATATECMDWVRHLKNDADIDVYKVGPLSSLGSPWSKLVRYKTTNPQWEVIAPKGLQLSSSPNGREIMFRTDFFTTRLILDEQSNCKNVIVTSDGSPAFRGVQPNTPHRFFYYDWNICRQALQIIGDTDIFNSDLSQYSARLTPLMARVRRFPYAAPEAITKQGVTGAMYEKSFGNLAYQCQNITGNLKHLLGH